FIAVVPGVNDLLLEGDIRGHLGSLRLPARMLHFSSFAGDIQLELQINLARSAAPTSLTSLAIGALYARRGIDALAELAARCNILFANCEEISALLSMPAGDYEIAAWQFLEKFARCQAVVVTLGAGHEFVKMSHARCGR